MATDKQYTLKTLAQCWEEFAGQVLGPETEPDSRLRAKMVFYAGAAFMFDQNLAVGAPEVNEARGERHLESIGAELQEFRRELEAYLAKRLATN